MRINAHTSKSVWHTKPHLEMQALWNFSSIRMHMCLWWHAIFLSSLKYVSRDRLSKITYEKRKRKKEVILSIIINVGNQIACSDSVLVYFIRMITGIFTCHVYKLCLYKLHVTDGQNGNWLIAQYQISELIRQRYHVPPPPPPPHPFSLKLHLDTICIYSKDVWEPDGQDGSRKYLTIRNLRETRISRESQNLRLVNISEIFGILNNYKIIKGRIRRRNNNI